MPSSASSIPDTAALSLHDALPISCAVAALEAGVRLFDASVGGLGGCPYAPRATGNVATEDLVWLLEAEGAETGIDLDALIATSEWRSEERRVGKSGEGGGRARSGK